MNFFDGQNIDENKPDSFDNPPDGDYLATVLSADYKQAKRDPSTQFYAIDFEIIQGQCQGRHVFANFMASHEKQAVVERGLKMMKKLCLAAAGTGSIQHPEQLYNRPVTIRLKSWINKNSGETSQNVVNIGGPQGIVETKPQAQPTGVTRTTESFQGGIGQPPAGQMPPHPAEQRNWNSVKSQF